jgi:hypothetical protein
VEGSSPPLGRKRPRSGWRWHGGPPSATIHSPTRGSRFLPPEAILPGASARTQALLRPIAPGKVTTSFAPLGRVLFWELFLRASTGRESEHSRPSIAESRAPPLGVVVLTGSDVLAGDLLGRGYFSLKSL